jgi:adenine-specific DNA-methyltransferase
MAAIDDLLARIEDAALRADLERELAPLRDDQELGLVYERHLPEKVRLHGLPIRRGALVEYRADTASPSWQVRAVKDGQAQLYRRTGTETLTDTAPVEDLVLVREFGQPIYPGLRPIGRIENGGDKPFHTVINGENYHALEALVYAYEDQVDAIYIDPPYNSGARDWKYNNNYVDDSDGYRHSKWLSFMEKRLKLAKRLLRPDDAVLIVAIDENEVHRLTLLLESLFPSSKIQMVTVLINPAGATIIDQFHRVDEHLLFVHIGAARPQRTIADTTILPSAKVADDEEPEDDDATDDAEAPKPKSFTWESMQRSGGNSRRQDTKAKFFPIHIHEATQRIVGCGDHLPEGEPRESAPPPPEGCVAQWPIKKDGSEACWQVSAPTFRTYLAEGRIRIGRRKANGAWGVSFLTKGAMRAIADGELVTKGQDEKGSLIVEVSTEKARTRPGKTMWTNGAYSATEHGSTLLRRFIPGRKFPFPKSLYAVEDALRFYIGRKSDALVVDFFGGSGTTTHAVARLNHADGGCRRSIVVTNNEVSEAEAEALAAKGHKPGDPEWEALGIFEYITRPRLEAAFTGATADGEPIDGEYRFIDPFPMRDGFEENLEFFQLTYEDPDLVQLGIAFTAVAPLLWLTAGAQGPRIDAVDGPWALPDEGRYGVLFDADHWPAFVEAVLTAGDAVTHAFVVTDSDAVFQGVIAELPDTVTPVRLYESYLTSFTLNTGARS